MSSDRESEWDCFIAYPTPQFDVAQQLATAVATRLRVFLDRWELRPGDDWPQAVAAALDVARIIVVIVAPETAGAYYEQEEIARAISRARTPGSDRRVVPLFVDGMTPGDSRVPYGLHTKQGLTIAKPGDLEKAAEAIVAVAEETAATAQFDGTTDSRDVSPAIRQYLAQLRISVERLTTDQYRVIQQLRYMRRVRISGCAGSGKTLVATEKATRLAKAGLRVLFLCHNPLLAEHVHHLTSGTGVEVKHFAQWVQELTGAPDSGATTPWTHFDEPDEQSLNKAFDVLTQRHEAFDAIIVDEGQDFREEWWSVVEAGLKSITSGHLYIFHDNNQSLLPLRGHYPIEEPRVDLSRNCRNAGRVFELMRCFDSSAPEPELSLRSRGRVLLKQYEPGTEISAIAPILQHLEREQLLRNTAVIVATDGPLSGSVLAGCEVKVSVTESWQDAVCREFMRVLRFSDGVLIVPPSGSESWLASELAQLSDQPYPSEDDINHVRQIAQGFSLRSETHARLGLFHWSLRWNSTERTLRLRRTTEGPTGAAEVLAYFQRAHWEQGIPRPKRILLQPFYRPLSPDQIPLYRVADFKGLEADAVVLILRGRAANHKGATYVGISRARAMLCVLSDYSAIGTFPRDFAWDS